MSLLAQAVATVVAAVTIWVVFGPTVYKLFSLCLFAGLALWSFAVDDTATGVIVAVVFVVALRMFAANPR